MPNTAIFVRSPYVLSVTGVANNTTRCDLFIWNSPDSIPATPTRVLSKPVPSSIQTTVYYDISEYCRSFINPIKYNEITAVDDLPVNEYCFCTAKTYLNGVLEYTYTFICFDGYGYYEDGMNPIKPSFLLDEGTYQIKENANSGGITIHNDGVDTWYITWRALSDTGTTYSSNTPAVNYAPYIHENLKGTGGNILRVYKNDVLQATYRFVEVCEPKYEVMNLDFINKYGVWQRLVLFKASYNMLDTSSTDFNMMSPTPDYNPSLARKQVFNVNGSKKIRVNTGFVDEDYDEVMQQILLSEQIKIDDKPVKVGSKNIDLHKSINKKMINYEITFEYAYAVINNIQ